MQARLACAALAALAASVLACASPAQRERHSAARDSLVRSLPPPTVLESEPFAGASELGRRALVLAVLARNPDVAAARESWRAALARYPQATALADPRFGYGVRPRSLGDDELRDAHDFELLQELEFPGKRRLRGEAALALADVAALGVEQARVRLAALASQAFDALWLAERGLEATAQHRSLLDELHRSALSRYTAGIGRLADALSAESEATMLEHRSIELGAEQRIAAARINTLLRRAPDAQLPALALELEAPASGALETGALFERARAARPDRQALEAEVRARESAVELARLDYFPDFALRGAYEGSEDESRMRPFVGVMVDVPLQLARRRGALEEADAEVSRARSRAARLDDRVRFEVASALERVHEARHLEELARERIVPASRDRLASLRAAYETGGASLFEVVDAERSLRSAELALHEARARAASSLAELARAVGVVSLEEESP